MRDSRCPPNGYSVGLMAEYVAEMISGFVIGRAPVSAGFCTSLYGLLSETKLPGATVLLGLAYLSNRIQTLPTIAGTAPPLLARDKVWEMLTVAVMLGSKYLDDGTYSNTSWAIVSGIPRDRLNRLEREWLEAIQWSLFVDLDSDPAYSAWIASWQGWLFTKTIQITQNISSAWFPVCERPKYARGMASPPPISLSSGQDDAHRTFNPPRQLTPLHCHINPGTPLSVTYRTLPSMSSNISNTTSFSWTDEYVSVDNPRNAGHYGIFG